ncbi:MAG: hypothetical protein V8R91_20230 [Butyricimonas faecihominis]
MGSELFSVGKNWTPESGKPGVIWAAQRVPDDEIAMIPNWSIIKEIDLSKPATIPCLFQLPAGSH